MSVGPILGPTGLPLVGGGGLPRVGDPATEDCCCDDTVPLACCTGGMIDRPSVAVSLSGWVAGPETGPDPSGPWVLPRIGPGSYLGAFAVTGVPWVRSGFLERPDGSLTITFTRCAGSGKWGVIASFEADDATLPLLGLGEWVVADTSQAACEPALGAFALSSAPATPPSPPPYDPFTGGGQKWGHFSAGSQATVS